MTGPRETVYIITSTRGGEEFASIVLSHSQRSKFMTAIETLISTMPENMRLLLVNKGYSSRPWFDLVSYLSKERGESASSADEVSDMEKARCYSVVLTQLHP